MFRARRMMELDTLVAAAQAEQDAEAARLAEEEAMMAALAAADSEATTVLNLSEVLSRLEVGRLDQDRTGVQVLGAAGSRRDIVLICPGDPDEEGSELITGPWLSRPQPTNPTKRADEESSEIIRGPWRDPASIPDPSAVPEPAALEMRDADEEISELIEGPWTADEEATCMYNQAELEALLSR